MSADRYKGQSKADALFIKLAELAPCKSCPNETCEECRWTTFAAGRIERSWDHWNYLEGEPRPAAGTEKEEKK